MRGLAGLFFRIILVQKSKHKIPKEIKETQAYAESKAIGGNQSENREPIPVSSQERRVVTRARIP
jgi:hypothetical protein